MKSKQESDHLIETALFARLSSFEKNPVTKFTVSTIHDDVRNDFEIV